MRHTKEYLKLENTCAVYGKFDGMHRGHLKVVKKVAEEAKKAGLASVIVSFSGEKQVLTTEQEKAYFAEKEGIDTFISTVEEEMDIAEFVKEILSEQLGVKILVVGENHSDLAEVKEQAEKNGMEVLVVETEKEGSETITRDTILQAYQDSDYEKIETLCGHPFIIMGEVVHGKALGRTVGMPTANVGVPENKIKPIDGVYATLGHVAGGVYKSLTNIGRRPSVDSHDYVTIEAFLLDFKKDIYGEPFLLEVHKFIRGVRKFDNLEEVQQQVQVDLGQVRDFLEKIA